MMNTSEIRSSIECADVLNSLDDDLENKQIDELVNEAIMLERSVFDDNIFNTCIWTVCLCNCDFAMPRTKHDVHRAK